MPIRNGNDKTARRRLLVRARNDNDSVESNINVRNKARKRRSGREKGAADGGLARGYCVLPRTKAAPARTSTLQALLQAQNKPRCFPYNRIISKFTSNSNRTARCFPIELRIYFICITPSIIFYIEFPRPIIIYSTGYIVMLRINRKLKIYN